MASYHTICLLALADPRSDVSGGFMFTIDVDENLEFTEYMKRSEGDLQSIEQMVNVH